MSISLIHAINTVLDEAGLLRKRVDAEWDHISQMAINAWHTKVEHPTSGPINAPTSLTQLPSDMVEKVQAALARSANVTKTEDTTEDTTEVEVDQSDKDEANGEPNPPVGDEKAEADGETKNGTEADEPTDTKSEDAGDQAKEDGTDEGSGESQDELATGDQAKDEESK